MRWFALLILVGLATSCRAHGVSAGERDDALGSTAWRPSSLEQRVHGCYLLRSGAWEHDAELNRIQDARHIPRQLRFTVQRLAGWEPLQSDSLPLYAVETEPGPPATRVFSFWRAARVGGDSIHVGVPLPLAGTVLRLAPVPDGLAGYLTTFTDAIPRDGVASVTAPVVLDRVRCEPRQAQLYGSD